MDDKLTGNKLRIEYVELSRVAIWDKNPKVHDIGGLYESIKMHGFRDAPIYDGKIGGIIAGNGRAEVLMRMRGDREEPPEGVATDDKGSWYIPIQFGIDAKSVEAAEAFGIDHNNLTMTGGDFTFFDMAKMWDKDRYADVLSGLAEAEVQLASLSAEDIDTFLHGIVHEEEMEEIKGAKPNPRKNIPLDLILCLEPLQDPAIWVAHSHGWKIGTRTKLNHKWLIDEKYIERWAWKFDLALLDNDFKEYDANFHNNMVKKYRPKYCTVRDIMTKDQCKADGIDYYSLEQILDWAEELNDYCENVILIPKYDCLDKIDDKFMLGFSVPSKYAGTPIPAEEFKGRRVHLLGGSWTNQLAYLSILEEDVVSLDNNWLHRIAQFGQYVMPDGRVKTLTDDLPGTAMSLYACISLSMANIVMTVNELNASVDTD